MRLYFIAEIIHILPHLFCLKPGVICQEIGWFDIDSHSSGAVSSRLATDAAHLRGALADQVALVCQNLVTVVSGCVLGARPPFQCF